jgi:hypothetical protein
MGDQNPEDVPIPTDKPLSGGSSHLTSLRQKSAAFFPRQTSKTAVFPNSLRREGGKKNDF